MPITKLKTLVTEADRPFFCSRDNGDGTVTLYYPGDVIPALIIVPSARQFSPKEFRNFFTTVELAAIVASIDPGVRLMLLRISTEGVIDMGNPDILIDMLNLVAKGLLTNARRLAFLA